MAQQGLEAELAAQRARERAKETTERQRAAQKNRRRSAELLRREDTVQCQMVDDRGTVRGETRPDSENLALLTWPFVAGLLMVATAPLVIPGGIGILVAGSAVLAAVSLVVRSRRARIRWMLQVEGDAVLYAQEACGFDLEFWPRRVVAPRESLKLYLEAANTDPRVEISLPGLALTHRGLSPRDLDTLRRFAVWATR